MTPEEMEARIAALEKEVAELKTLIELVDRVNKLVKQRLKRPPPSVYAYSSRSI